MNCGNSNCTDPNCDGLGAAHRIIVESINSGTWAIIAVNANPGFVYTVGLHLKNLPELIMVGLSPSKTQSIINDCGEWMVENGEFKHGTQIDDLANMPTVIIDVAFDEKEEYAIQAFNYYGHWEFRMQQLVMPDKNWLFPWDHGFSQKMASAQTVLGNPPIERMN